MRAQQPVVAAIERAVREFPEHAAIETASGLTTYRELGAEARDFVARLELATAPGEFIGITASRNAASIVALVGALAAERPFVFVDPRDSDASNEKKVTALGLRVFASETADSSPTPLLSEVPAHWRGDASTPQWPRARGGGLGYAIHTSGSTGEPKCVLVRTEPMARVMEDHVRRLEVGPGSRTLQFARRTFDGCLTEILWTLTAGACLVVPRTEQLSPGSVLQETLESLRITHLKTTPFALTATQPSSAMSLQHVINGGGACRPAVVRKWCSVAAFHNAYGTTETTVCNLLSAPLNPDACAESVPLGDVVGDCGYYLAPPTGTHAEADAGTEAGEGLAVRRGELVITGDSVAVGYLTADGVRPFTDGTGNRVYRTGDLVELRAGQLFFVERIDRQLKVRGFRLDPGEVETAACRLPGVVDAVVTAEAHDSGPVSDSADDALACYYQGEATPRRLRSHFETVLDRYKVPSVIHQVRELPYTKNGKVDRGALQAVRRAAQKALTSASPEEQVLHLVRQLTGVSDAGLDENFFSIGGDSASTLVLVQKLKELGWMDVGVRDVLRAENIKDLTSKLPTGIV